MMTIDDNRSAFGPESGCGAIEVAPIHAQLWLLWTAAGLRALSWANLGESAESALGKGHPAIAEIPAAYRDPLTRYLAGERVDFANVRVDLHGTPFQLKVWQALRRIPYGQVKSYASIAREIGSPRAMRAVGGANGKNPVAVIVPCHRVVEADMTIGGYSGGLDRKRFLLQLEGAQLTSDLVQPGQLDLLGRADDES